MDPRGSFVLEGDSGAMGSLVPSPRSDAVTHDLEELSLQPIQSLPPLKERKNVLQLRLQQRRTREQLAAQGIMPPLKTPAVFHEQVRSLERARTENFLKHKIRSRPKRAELVRMHILQETQAEPSLQATQMKLKRARLANDLNEKIAQRPGPMELVVKNILPVDSTVTKAIIDNDENSLDVYKFDDDSSDALSPEQPASHESQSSASSPIEARMSDISSVSPSASSSIQLCPPTNLTRTSVEDQASSREMTITHPVTAAAPTKPGPTLVKQSQPKQAGEKSRSKKSREPKPRVRRLKYHQYIPPDQKQEPNEAPMDSAYARLLQQQQQFLQLQIISQQQQHYNYQAILPAPLKPVAESQNSCPNVTLTNSPSLHTPFVVSLPSTAPSRPNNTANCRKQGALPSSLDEMKVAELKTELKLRGLPVSGTKMDLIERLKARQETSQLADTNISKSALQADGMSTTPPVSPEASSINMEENKDSPAKALSPLKHEDVAMETKVSEKDQRLHEKERQIEELMRKLEQEQRLVEELKMQLEVEKRSQQGGPEPESPVHVKDENGAAPSCNFKTSPLRQTTVVKQEESRFQMHHTPVQQYYINAQQVPNVLHQQTEAMINTQPATQILLPLSLPNSINLTNNPITTQAQSILQSSVPALAQNLLQTQMSDNTLTQQHSNQTQTSPQALSLCASSTSGFEYRQNQNQSMAEMPQCFLSTSPRVSPRHTTPNGPSNKPPSPCQMSNILQPSTFTNHHSPKSKDPPRYEEAVKQTRGLQASMQVPTATSQHMDDLFDILIESGEISPMTRQDPSLDKHLPVTANITTLPINTVLSRPPPQIHVARTPNQPQVALASDNQLEALLGETEPRTLRLIEELKSQLLDQPHSPMDTSDLTFSDTPTSALHLQDTGLDNMEWLDLTIPGTAGISSSAVFSSDFLDSPDLQLHWD
ncbi:myocardin-related transcription factor B isoform X1 [Paramisgurnus dabryanus]|uniref:myocardin-related transcription factor B isoform X1 n=1 Tax=Paramisgurnus dabryanus TaxID=90735 RepID=UPI0031F44143